jgi:hypothetical protein
LVKRFRQSFGGPLARLTGEHKNYWNDLADCGNGHAEIDRRPGAVAESGLL